MNATTTREFRGGAKRSGIAKILRTTTAALVAAGALLATVPTTADAQPKGGGSLTGRLGLGIEGPVKRGPRADLCISGLSCVPRKKALLVLLENEGYPAGLPEDITLDIPTCGDFELVLPPDGDLLGAIAEIAIEIASTAAECFNPGNWAIEQVSLTDFVVTLNDFSRVVTDTVMEDIGVATIENSDADKVYDRIVILQDGDLTVTKIREKLAELAPTHVVDVHVLAHGGKTGFGPKDDSNERRVPDDDVREFGNIPGLHLRAIYQQTCMGTFLNDDWEVAGAKVVSGTVEVNYMGLSYGSFLEKWVAGKKFRKAVDEAFVDWTPFYETVFGFVDLYKDGVLTDGKRDKRDPPLFSMTGNLSAEDELDASVPVIVGNGDIRVTD